MAHPQNAPLLQRVSIVGIHVSVASSWAFGDNFSIYCILLMWHRHLALSKQRANGFSHGPSPVFQKKLSWPLSSNRERGGDAAIALPSAQPRYIQKLLMENMKAYPIESR